MKNTQHNGADQKNAMKDNGQKTQIKQSDQN